MPHWGGPKLYCSCTFLSCGDNDQVWWISTQPFKKRQCDRRTDRQTKPITISPHFFLKSVWITRVKLMATITNPHTSLPKQSWKMEKKKSPAEITQCQISHWIHFSPLTPMTPSPLWCEPGVKIPQNRIYLMCSPMLIACTNFSFKMLSNVPKFTFLVLNL